MEKVGERNVEGQKLASWISLHSCAENLYSVCHSPHPPCCAHTKATYHLPLIIYYHVGIVMFLIGKNHFSTNSSIKSEKEKNRRLNSSGNILPCVQYVNQMYLGMVHLSPYIYIYMDMQLTTISLQYSCKKYQIKNDVPQRNLLLKCRNWTWHKHCIYWLFLHVYCV